MIRKNIYCLLFSLVLLTIFSNLRAQDIVENLIVETYYVSDSNDATDTLGGKIEPGSVTYRVFIDLAPGIKLKAIFGSGGHPLLISSTSGFFNNELLGKSFGNEIKQTQLKMNTLALDTWLSLGFASNKHYGILKAEDPDSSIIGGKYNNGGSDHIPGGLLVNNDPLAGVPITEKDGIFQTDITSSDFINQGIVDPITQIDTTIFGNPSNSGSFYGADITFRSNSGICIPETDNKILIAQLTTKGELSFEFNIEVEDTIHNKSYIYVASGELKGDTLLSPFLKYPPKCGCTDPNYLEFDPLAPCNDGSCKTLIVLGCTDISACNYNPGANKNVPGLCCYNSACAFDLGLICEGVVYGCTDPNSLNYNPEATATSDIDTCCYDGGCMDDRYIEYDPSACFDDGSYCKILKLAGCMDRGACNYNPFATDSSDCIYDCNKNSDQVNKSVQQTPVINFELYPSPANDLVFYRIHTTDKAFVSYSFCDIYGNILDKAILGANGFFNGTIDISDNTEGVYIFKLYVDEYFIVKRIIKL